jgi:outer membrane receptor protein involved in Fe transport
MSHVVRLRLGSAPLALVLALAAGSAHAQAPAQGAAEAPAATGEDILVTGSRIRVADHPQVEPLVTIGADYLADRNLFNVADALRESPGIRGTVSPNGTQGLFGQGVNYTNLYGLGTNRTLTLVNGRRVVTSTVPTSAGLSPGTQVDLNIIPTILIDHVDRLSVGGAPVYGTDAIAGTVNVVLKRRLTRLIVEGSAGITSAGDNQRLSLSAAGGFDFADGRGNITGAISWNKSDGVAYNARSFLAANVFSLTNPCSTFGTGQVCTSAGSQFYLGNYGTTGRTAATDGRVNPSIGYNNSAADGNPGSVLVANAYYWGLTTGGLILNPATVATSAAGVPTNGGRPLARFDSAGNIVTYNPGVVYPAGRASGGDGYRVNDYAQITSNLERLNTNLFFTFDLTDRVRLFAEGTWSHSRGDQITAAPLNNAVIQGGANSYLTFSVNNPLLSAQAKSWLAGNGYTTTFVLSRTDADLVDLSGESTIDLYRGVGGVDGKFDLLGRGWNFEAYVNYGRSDVVDRFQDINQQNFINAVNGCSTTSTVSLGGVATVPVADAACQALNLFGDHAASAAALAYIQQNNVNRSRLEQTVANANIGGTAFDLNGNPVSLNFGFEHHTETGRFTPDSFMQRGLGRSAAVQPTAGSYRMNEEFVETLVPLISPANHALISRLEVFGRFRNVDNSTNGNFQSWAVGGTVAPMAALELRGNFTRSFRAPAITELYSTRTTGNFTVLDLCSPSNINAGPVPTIRAANCAAFLAKYPTATPLLAATAPVPGYLGGNPNLRNEVANSFTYGFVLRPHFAPGLSFSADYVNIKVTDPITSLTIGSATVTGIVQGCFDNPSFNAADPANGNAFCSLIQRDANGQVVSSTSSPGITTGYVNGKRMTMDGIQTSLNWATRLGGGMFGLGLESFYLRHRLVDITGVSPTQSEGLLGDPQFQSQLRLRWENAAFGTSATVNYTGIQAFAYTNRADQPNDIRELDHYDAYATLDAGIWVKPGKDMRLTLTVTNLLNRQGQYYNGTIIPTSVNDALGRRFAITARTTY